MRYRVLGPIKVELDGRCYDIPAAKERSVLAALPNLDAALAEMRRVLKPDGSLHFVEHGHAPDDKIARWQERLEPTNKRLAGGCHLTRHISKDIERAGFRIDTYYFKGEPKPMGYNYEGRAVCR